MKNDFWREFQLRSKDFQVSVERNNDFGLNDSVEEVAEIVAPARKNKVNTIAFDELWFRW